MKIEFLRIKGYITKETTIVEHTIRVPEGTEPIWGLSAKFETPIYDTDAEYQEGSFGCRIEGRQPKLKDAEEILWHIQELFTER